MKNRHDTATAEAPEELLENLRQLVAEAEKLVGEGGEQAEEAISGLRERFEQAREKVEEMYGVARKKVIVGARRADETIRSHPYESLAITLGIGVLIGALIRRRD
jgi:ElaB/YqjD/DUF883 family membrane-anchored ribosome-binding protein